MPQASDEQRADWGIAEDKAEDYLFWHGWLLCRGWLWWHHDWEKALMDDDAYEAMKFLVDEWDYGGVLKTGPIVSIGKRKVS